jgi:tellurium resistance protein TerD
MSIDLKKGNKINLSKDGSASAPPLKYVNMGLGWKPQTNPGEDDFDLDSNVFCLNDQGKLPSDEHFVFYNNKLSPDGAIRHMGDNRTGTTASTDAETIKIDLTEIDPQIKKISLVISIDEAKARHQNFGRVKDSYVRLVDKETGKELVRYNLDDIAPTAIGVHVGDLERQSDDTWTFEAIGQGYDKELADFVHLFGGDC